VLLYSAALRKYRVSKGTKEHASERQVKANKIRLSSTSSCVSIFVQYTQEHAPFSIDCCAALSKAYPHSWLQPPLCEITVLAELELL
jgi:hypothetical protein